MHSETGADGSDPEGDRPATRDLSDASAATMCSGNGAAADTKVEEGEADVAPTLPLIFETFEDMGLKAGLLRGILAAGLERPSPLQLAAAVPILGGTDTILLHRNCTGATTSLVIGMLQRVDPSVKFVQAIFVAASPELAMGAQGYFSSLGKYSSLKILALARSGSERDTTLALRGGVQIVVGTPGSVSALMQRQTTTLARTQMVVLDGLDWMLHTGLNEQLLSILTQDRRNDTHLCVATTAMGPEAEALVAKHMWDPLTVATSKGIDLTLEGVRQFYVNVGREGWKLDTLRDLLETVTFGSCVVFAATRYRAHSLAGSLTEHGIDATAATSDMEADAQADALRRFQDGSVNVLVYSNSLVTSSYTNWLSANLLVCYDLPRKAYVSCFGRSKHGSSGSSGSKCVGVSFVTTDDVPALREIERFYDISIEEMPLDIDDLLC